LLIILKSIRYFVVLNQIGLIKKASFVVMQILY